MRHGDTVADAIAIVAAMTADELAHFLDALAGMPRVEAAGWRVRERRLSPERFPERNRKIRLLAKRLSYGQVAKMFGMSRSSVAKICQRGPARSVDIEIVSTSTNGYA